MKKQSNYVVVSNTVKNGLSFSNTVNKMLSEGYTLAGGIQIVNGEEQMLYQSLVKETETGEAQAVLVSAPEKLFDALAVSVTEEKKKPGRPKKVVV